MVMTVNIPKPILTLRRKLCGKLLISFYFKDDALISIIIIFVRTLYIYTVSCRGVLSKTQKEQLMIWIQSQKAKEGGESQLLEKWGFTREEYAALIGKLL